MKCERLAVLRPLLLASLLLAGCGGIRQSLAEEGYLQQLLYDYSYDVPLDRLWTEARAVTGAAEGAEQTEQGGRTVTVSPRWEGASGLVIRGWEAEGRSYLRIFNVKQGAPRPHDSDITARAVELELRVLERFHPEDARRFREGAQRAGQRAR